MRRMLWLAAVTVATAPLVAQQPPASWAAATAAFDAYAQADSTVGGALVLVGENGTVAEHYHGFADRGAGTRANAHTIWHWGSITKTLTAVGVMQLVERGKLRLDQPIGSKPVCRGDC